MDAAVIDQVPEEAPSFAGEVGNARPAAPDDAVDARAVARATPRTARNFAHLFGGQVVTWTMTFAWTLIVPRVLGPEGFGVLTTALAVSGAFGVILGLGTRNYLVRAIVMDPEEAGRLVGTALVLRVALAPVAALAAVVFAQLAGYDSQQTIALYLATAMNLLVLLGDPLLATFQAIERMKYLAYSDMINKTAQAVFGIAIALVGLGAIGIAANMAIVAVVVVGLNLLWIRRYLRIDPRTTTRRMARMVRDSFAFWATIVFFTIYLWIDTIMLSLMTDAKVVGWYGAATTLFQTLMFLPNLLATSWLPRLVEAFKGGPERLNEAARRPLGLVLVISAPVAAGTAMAGGVLIHLLYGPSYENAVPAMVILGLCLPPTYLNIMMSQVLVADGRQKIFQWLMLGALVINPLLNLVLIPATQSRYHNGSIGAALAMLATEVLVAGAAFIAVRRVFTRAVLKRGALAVAASLAMWAVARLASPLGQPAALAAGIVTLIALVLILRIPSSEEREFVLAAFRRFKARAGR